MIRTDSTLGQLLIVDESALRKLIDEHDLMLTTFRQLSLGGQDVSTILTAIRNLLFRIDR